MFKNFTGFNLVEQMHKLRQNNRFSSSLLKKKSIGLIFVAIIVLVLWFLPTESFGIDGLTQVQQRIIAIFVYATLMWVFELVPAWATSVSIIVLLLLCTSDSGIKWICNPETADEEHHHRVGETSHHLLVTEQLARRGGIAQPFDAGIGGEQQQEDDDRNRGGPGGHQFHHPHQGGIDENRDDPLLDLGEAVQSERLRRQEPEDEENDGDKQ